MSDSFFERAGSAAQIVSELGLQVDVRSGGQTNAHVVVQSAVCLPGGALRTSVLATWADVVTGMSASHAILPRIPVTLDLETQVVRPTAAGATLHVTSVPAKIGRRIVTSRAEFVDAADGTLVAISYASFIASPNPDHVLENGFPDTIQTEHRLPMPLEERTQRVIVCPGVVDLPRLPDGQNATGAIQGGLVCLGAEEAILSAVAPGTSLGSLTMRYFRPFMIGPARATADVTGPVATVELVDLGTGKVGAVATARLI
jgi:acyl-coenzyme A thioesterase PaaI-like protein